MFLHLPLIIVIVSFSIFGTTFLRACTICENSSCLHKIFSGILWAGSSFYWPQMAQQILNWSIQIEKCISAVILSLPWGNRRFKRFFGRNERFSPIVQSVRRVRTFIKYFQASYVLTVHSVNFRWLTKYWIYINAN